MYSTDCPVGFEEVGDFCFVKGNERKNYEDANTACQEMGGFVVEPRTAELSAALSTFTFETDILWIGLTKPTSTSQFVWSTDNKPLTSNSWSNWNQPTLGGNVNLHCVGTMKNNNKWDDVHCRWLMEFVCQANKRESFCVMHVFTK